MCLRKTHEIREINETSKNSSGGENEKDANWTTVTRDGCEWSGL